MISAEFGNKTLQYLIINCLIVFSVSWCVCWSAHGVVIFHYTIDSKVNKIKWKWTITKACHSRSKCILWTCSLSGVEMISLLFLRHADSSSSYKERERIENVQSGLFIRAVFLVNRSGSCGVTLAEILAVNLWMYARYCCKLSLVVYC
jgi:lysylphosphatidylglycerol synthetase-like protein (DUF2156 family)